METNGQLHAPAALPPEKEPLVSRAGLDTVVKRNLLLLLLMPSLIKGFLTPGSSSSFRL
jgi:hypothetical protein